MLYFLPHPTIQSMRLIYYAVNVLSLFKYIQRIYIYYINLKPTVPPPPTSPPTPSPSPPSPSHPPSPTSPPRPGGKRLSMGPVDRWIFLRSS